jgi:uncharacterized membrane protein
MKSHVRLPGHSVHQMLVVFPLCLLATSVICDLLDVVTTTGAFLDAAYWIIPAGVVGGVAAAPFGFIDWLHIPRDTRARRVGAWHGLGNAAVLALFAASWWLRDYDRDVPVVALALSLIGAALSLVTAWLGAEMVARLGIGVYEDASADAPSSLFAWWVTLGWIAFLAFVAIFWMMVAKRVPFAGA